MAHIAHDVSGFVGGCEGESVAVVEDTAGLRLIRHDGGGTQGERWFEIVAGSVEGTDLAAAVSPDSKIDVIGIRPGEKLHEVLVTEEESRHTLEFDDTYVVQPDHPYWEKNGKTQIQNLKPGSFIDIRKKKSFKSSNKGNINGHLYPFCCH